jgi:hypothetical protein
MTEEIKNNIANGTTLAALSSFLMEIHDLLTSVLVVLGVILNIIMIVQKLKKPRKPQ